MESICLKPFWGRASDIFFLFFFSDFFLCPVFFFHRFLEVAVGSTGVWWCCCCPCCFGCGCRCRLCLLKFIHPRTFYVFHGRRVFCFGVLLNRRTMEHWAVSNGFARLSKAPLSWRMDTLDSIFFIACILHILFYSTFWRRGGGGQNEWMMLSCRVLSYSERLRNLEIWN